MRQAAFFSDNNFQDYEFTRLNTYKKKEIRRSQFFSFFGNYCPKKQAACGEEKRHHCIR